MGKAAAQETRDGPRVLRDGHLVVVEDDDEPTPQASRLVQRLEGHAAAEGSVADDGHDMLGASLQVPGHGHAQRGGDGCRCMSHAKAVKGAFRTVGEAGHAAVAAQRAESAVSSGEDLPWVALMPDIPDDAVPRRIEAGEERYGQLDDSQGRCKMPPVAQRNADDGIAQFLGESMLFLHLEPADAAGQVERRQDGRFHGSP